MFERFTERAKRVIFFARYEAANRGSRDIATEHLLFGILRESQGAITRHLQSRALSVRDLVSYLESHVPCGDPLDTSVQVPLSNTSRHVLELAVEEAQLTGCQRIGPEHIFIALAREPSTKGGAVLPQFGLDTNALRADVALARKQ